VESQRMGQTLVAERPQSHARIATVVATDSRPIARAGLAAVLEGSPGVLLAAIVDPRHAQKALAEHLPSVLLVSVPGTDTDPFRVVVEARQHHPTIHTLLLTDAASVVDVQTGVAAGVDSFLLSSAGPDELVEGIVTTARGERALSPELAMHLASAWRDTSSSRGRGDHLTARELEVLAQLAEGLTNQQIGEELDMSTRTVKTHVQSLLTKLDAADRTAAVARAFRQGLVR
jgi:DNA-binding NarL/FixJ family response regulator